MEVEAEVRVFLPLTLLVASVDMEDEDWPLREPFWGIHEDSRARDDEATYRPLVEQVDEEDDEVDRFGLAGGVGGVGAPNRVMHILRFCSQERLVRPSSTLGDGPP